MKACFSIFFILFALNALSQSTFDGRWKLDHVTYKGNVLFDRSAGPVENTTSRISVTFMTSDENFNRSMNTKPYYYFANSEIGFVKDSMFYRISTSTKNGTYNNEFHFGTYTVPANTNMLYLDLKAQQPIRQSYQFSFKDSILILQNADLIAEYKLQPSPIKGVYNAPWKDTDAPIIIDAYHLNEIEWDLILQDKRVHGVIHKAGEGMVADPKYSSRKSAVKKRNLLWGSYFMGTDDDPVEQADFYYKFAGGDSTELYCLDLEDTKAKGRMNLKQAKKFIERWYELTGKYPVLYCNKNVLSEINQKYGANSIFSKCPLWYARFRSDIPDWEISTWETYTFWQFSSEINCEKTGECLYNVPGTKYDMDVNVFNGTYYELRILWPNF